MIIEFVYSRDDLKEAARTHVKARLSGFGAPLAEVRQFVGWAIFVGLAVVLLVLLQRANRIQPTPPIVASPFPSPWIGIIVAIIPWLLLVFFLRFFMHYAKAYVVQCAWERDPAMQLRRTIDADASRFIIDNGQTRTERKWKGFRRFIETQNLFLLYESDYTFDIVSKRAFRSPQQLEEFRALLNEQIHPPTGGFPVQPPPTS